MRTQVPETSPLVFKQPEATNVDMWQALQNTIDDAFNNQTIDLTDRATLDTDLPFTSDLETIEAAKLDKSNGVLK